jgi:hypothetical protein
MTPALDRIIKIEPADSVYWERPDFNPEDYFKDAIGVSVSPSLKPMEVDFFVNHTHAPYVMTKPLHWSQELLDKDHYGMTFRINVQHNFELEKALLAFGDGLMVIKPERLKRSIRARLEGAIDLYNTDLHDKGLVSASRKLKHKGFGILNHVYSQRAIKQMNRILDKDIGARESKNFVVRNLLENAHELQPMLLNKNLVRIVESIDSKANLVKAVFMNKQPSANWMVGWHQDRTIHVKKKVSKKGYSGWADRDGVTSVLPPEDVNKNVFTIRVHLDDANRDNGCLRVLPGSHNRILSDDEIETITENSVPYDCEISSGGVLVMKPLLLHSSNKSSKQRSRRVIHMEFSSVALPNGLEWAELTKL